MRCVSGLCRSPSQEAEPEPEPEPEPESAPAPAPEPEPPSTACAPATLKYRRLIAPNPYSRLNSVSVVSTANLDAPYGLVGRVGSVSCTVGPSGSPYTAAVDENTIVRIRISRIASSSVTVPPRLFDQYLAGSAT